MSGGEFEYVQDRISVVADEFEENLEHYAEYEYISPRVLASFKETIYLLRVAAVRLQRADWLISGDDGEETYWQRMANDLKKIPKP